FLRSYMALKGIPNPATHRCKLPNSTNAQKMRQKEMHLPYRRGTWSAQRLTGHAAGPPRLRFEHWRRCSAPVAHPAEARAHPRRALLPNELLRGISRGVAISDAANVTYCAS